MPSGVLTAPGAIGKETAERLKTDWQANYSGENYGKVAVLGDNLRYERMALTAEESQLIDQLKWSAEVVCSVFRVPPYKVGLGAMPTYNNIQSLNVEYYSQALQSLIEAAEECLDEGLGIGWAADPSKARYGTEFDVGNLLRMDSVTQMDMLDKAKSIMTPDEQRKQLDLPATPGGNVVYRQQQDYSLAALAKRDAQDDPFGTKKPAPAAAPPANDNAAELEAAKAMIEIHKGLSG
jgi:HK97 family phage portal protein